MEREQMDAVIKQVHALLRMASDADVDGEVAAAAAAAARLIERHGLERADLEAQMSAASQGGPPVKPDMAKVETHTHGERMSFWESILGDAVETLVGTVKRWKSSSAVVASGGAFGTRRVARCIVWAGPAEDVALAVELFETWQHVIATMAVGRYRGLVRGLGLRYATGFAASLRDRAEEEARGRHKLVSAGTTALAVRNGGGTLADCNRTMRAHTDQFIRHDLKVKLRTGSTRRLGHGGDGGIDAYNNGRDDGKRADFAATRRRKLA